MFSIEITHNFASTAIFNKLGLLLNSPRLINSIKIVSLSSRGTVCSGDVNNTTTVSQTLLSSFITFFSFFCHFTMNR